MGIILVLRSAKSLTADYPPSYGQIRDVTALGRKESPNIHRSSRTFCTEYMGYDRKGMPVSRPYAPCTPTVGRVI